MLIVMETPNSPHRSSLFIVSLCFDPSLPDVELDLKAHDASLSGKLTHSARFKSYRSPEGCQKPIVHSEQLHSDDSVRL